MLISDTNLFGLCFGGRIVKSEDCFTSGLKKMTIKQLFWKLFWLMIRGKGNSKILFDSEAVCFKTHMVEICDADFDPVYHDAIGYEFLALYWDRRKEHFVDIVGDIDDIQAIIKHATTNTGVFTQDELDSLLKKCDDTNIDDKVNRF